MNRLRFTYFAPFAIGVIISLVADRRFKRGLKDEIWSESELEPARVLIAKPVWSLTNWLLIGVVAVSVILIARSAHPGGTLFYVLLFPLHAVSRIRLLLKPTVKSTDGLKDWQNFNPIRSEHWGQASIPPSA